MIAQRSDVDDLAIRDAVSELQAFVLARYPDAVFEAFPNDEPEGVYLRIIVDIDDPMDVIEAILPRLAEMQTDGLPVYPSRFARSSGSWLTWKGGQDTRRWNTERARDREKTSTYHSM